MGGSTKYRHTRALTQTRIHTSFDAQTQYSKTIEDRGKTGEYCDTGESEALQ